MQQLLIIIHILVCVSIITLVLMQQGKGSGIGAAFGSGSSNTLFGSQGSMPFFMKLTAVCAVVFFATGLAIARLGANAQQSARPSLPTSTTSPAVPDLPVNNIAPSLPVRKSAVDNRADTGVKRSASKNQKK
jgi:preprotein translocase subunit SecG